MHLVETYALNCGLKIDQPFILEKFFPLDIENFITIHPNSKFPSKCYDYWQDVVDILYPVLEEKNIKILQIGTKDDVPLRNCLHSQGSTTVNQVAYLLSKSSLHLGADSFPTHVASGCGKKIVCLYSNNYASVVKPYWTDKKDCVLFEPDRSERKPSFSAEESPKTINTLNPEDIAASVFDLLNIKSNNNFKTVRKGVAYNNIIVELVPNCIANTQSIGIESIIVRMDLEFNEEILIKQLSQSKCSIITDKTINLDIIRQFRDNIKQFVYFIDETHTPSFISSLLKIGIPIILMSEMADEEIEKAKLDYMDFGVIQKEPSPSQEDIESLKNKNLENLYYKSKRILISNGKSYKSETAWREDIPSDPNDPTPLRVIDKKDFWDSIDEFYILEKTS
tara:strand:- start:1864 stop:3045 length:1182 start_codon:yes stop_codon:yes gene_type:complete